MQEKSFCVHPKGFEPLSLEPESKILSIELRVPVCAANILFRFKSKESGIKKSASCCDPRYHSQLDIDIFESLLLILITIR